MKLAVTCFVVFASVAMLLPSSSSGQAQAPQCAKSCTGLPNVRQEIHITITDEGQTCTLDPNYRQCILTQCGVSELPKSVVEMLKEQGCDLSSAQSRTTSCLVTLFLGVLLVVFFK